MLIRVAHNYHHILLWLQQSVTRRKDLFHGIQVLVIAGKIGKVGGIFGVHIVVSAPIGKLSGIATVGHRLLKVNIVRWVSDDKIKGLRLKGRHDFKAVTL